MLVALNEREGWMRFLVLLGVLAAGPACAQVLTTSVTAFVPDPNNKVPAFNAVPGAGIVTWSTGLAQGVLVGGQSYTYCVSLATATVDGNASIAYRITRGSTVIQSAVLIAAQKFKLSSNSVYYYCSGYTALPKSPGAAVLTGIVTYKPAGTMVTQASKASADVLLQ